MNQSPAVSAAENPCSFCRLLASNGIICDTCSYWWCPSCINIDYPESLPMSLYEFLQTLTSFPWDCPNCSNQSLPLQLLINDVLTKKELLHHKCNPDCFKIQAKGSATSTKASADEEPGGAKGKTLLEKSIVTVFQDMFSTQMAMMESQRREREHEREELRKKREQERQEQQKARQEELKVIIEAIKVSTVQGNFASGNSPGSQSSNGSHPPTLAKLPQIQLPTFSGNIIEWANFWESFKLNVDDRVGLQPKQKLDYLHQLLKGSALEKIKGLGLQGEKYEEAVKILEKEYGRQQRLEEECWKILRELPIARETYLSIEKFIDIVRSTAASLERMGIVKQTLDCCVSSLLLPKLSPSLKYKLQEKKILRKTHEERWTMFKFLDCLQEVKVLVQETPLPKEKRADTQTKEEPESLPPGTASFFQSAQSRRSLQCAFCGQDHFSDQCRNHPKISDRQAIVKRKRLCINCLTTGHGFNDCRRTKPCFYCRKLGHHSALCYSYTKTQAQENTQHIADFAEETNHYDSTVEQREPAFLAGADEEDGIIMATAQLPVLNPATRKSVKLTVYIYSGSRYTCIDRKAAHKLGLVPSRAVELKTARFNSNQTERVNAEVVNFEMNGPKGFVLNVNAYSIANMAPALPVYPTKLLNSTQTKLRRYKLLNQIPAKPSVLNIDILLGMDYWYSILGPKVCKTIPLEGALMLHCTPLGNLLAGNTLKAASVYPSFSVMHAHQKEDVSLLWTTEAIGISDTDKHSPKDNDIIFQKFKESTRFEDGRYQACWPWKSPKPEIASNFQTAKHRLRRTLNTLCPTESDRTLLVEYDHIIQDQLTKGVIEPAELPYDNAKLIHYISHFPVIRRDRATTKVRIVYDASAKTRANGLSLNDLMFTGVNFLQELVGLLIRFRLPRIIMIADVEKAFLQVGLQNQDRDAVRFLWFKDLDNIDVETNLQSYRFTRTPFGVVSSPYLLGATINHHMDLNPGEVASQVKGNTYMDNIFFSAKTTKEAVSIYNEAKKLFADAGMNLREWLMNDEATNQCIKPQDLIKENETKVLGLKWKSSTEQMHISVSKPEKAKVTKRSVLHNIAKVFDPLGFLSPLTIEGKILLQTLWKEGKDWDDDVSEECNTQWEKIAETLTQVGNFTFPRRVYLQDDASVQLLCFTDASPSAYAATVYLRQAVDKTTKCNLIFAKARVSPIKPMTTLPRLELLGVLIGARALRFVEHQLRRPVHKRFLWSDSQIALQWKQSKKQLEPYVQRRVDEIRGHGEGTLCSSTFSQAKIPLT